MWLLRNCCCGCTLRTGTIIIGSLSLIMVTAYFCLAVTAIALIEQNSDEINKALHHNSGMNTEISSEPRKPFFSSESEPNTIDFDIKDSANDENTNVQYYQFFKSYTIELLSLCAVGAGISMITSALLLVGAAKGHKWLLLPWIANISLGLIAYFVTSIYKIVKLSTVLTGGAIFFLILVICGVLALESYFLMVVISHFEELRKNKQEEGSNLGKIYSAPGPWSSSITNIIPNIPEKEGA